LTSHSFTRGPKEETFTREISFEINDEGQVRKRHGIAIFDFSIEYSLINLKFYKKISGDLNHAVAVVPPLDLLDRQWVCYMKIVHGRWYCKQDEDITTPLFKFPPKFQESDFYLVGDGHFDILLGRRDLKNFTTPPPDDDVTSLTGIFTHVEFVVIC
jgi:hypothetical protein